MSVFELISLVLENLSRRKGRVFLTAIGVVIGTAAVVVLVSLGIGLQQNATENLYGISDLARIDVYPGMGGGPGGGPIVIEMPGGGGGGEQEQILLTDALLAQIEAIPGVQTVIPRDYFYSGAILQAGRQEAWISIYGDGTDDLANLGLVTIQGTTALQRGEMIVGYSIPNNFYLPSQRPGQEIPPPPDLLNERVTLVLMKYTDEGEVRRTFNVNVVGLLVETRGESDWSVYMSIEDVTAYNEWVNGSRIDRNKIGYSTAIVRVSDPRDALTVADAIKALGANAYAPQEFVEGINNFFVVLQVVFGGVGAIALLVAAIGIANSMTMSVLERTREIGLMKAIGASNRDVLSVFLGEAAGIGFLGGLGGVLLGYSAGQIINVLALVYLTQQAAETGSPPPTTAVATPLWLPIFAMVFAALIGLISGLYPALRAATLVPVVALKYE